MDAAPTGHSGTAPDAEVAARVGKTVEAVRIKRIRLGIPRWHPGGALDRRGGCPGPETASPRGDAADKRQLEVVDTRRYQLEVQDGKRKG